MAHTPVSIPLPMLCHEHDKLSGLTKMDFGETALSDHLKR